jgi:hypothetical protein
MNFRSNRFGRKQKSPLAGAFGDPERTEFKLFGGFEETDLITFSICGVAV